MKSKNQGIVGGIALAVALACASTAHAANDAIVTSSAQIGNLTFRLVDLDPNDGIAPSARFDMAVYLTSDSPDGYSHYDGSLLPSTSMQFNVGNQSTSASPSGLYASTSLTSQDLTSQVDPATQGNQWIDMWAPTTWVAAWGPDQEVAPVPKITLSANTAIAISGTATINSSFNATRLNELLTSMVPTDGVLNAYLAGELNPTVHLKLSTDEGNLADSGSWNNTSTSEFNLAGAWHLGYWIADGNLPTDLVNQTFEGHRDFTIQYANFGATDKSLDLEMALQADAYAFGQVSLTTTTLPPIDTPTIPEPSTYALMALGLVGIGLARRKAAR